MDVVVGRCRCGEEEAEAACCSPHVFTSVLLGVLACVLMTGGVFLAFHRWDPLWLIVSGIGVLLILIGSLLHCSSSRTPPRHHRPGGKCCPPGVDSPPHMAPINEQLMPLSNARSVSQLSLNMLPGYFPPVVTTYGIEQHSAVIHNIQQQNGGPAAGSPGGFILLSLPGGERLATLYHVEGSPATESPAAEGIPVAAATGPATPNATSVVPPPPLYRSVEVQTCDSLSNPPSSSNLPSRGGNATSPSSEETTTRTDACVVVNLMDADIPRVCDNNNDPPLPAGEAPIVRIESNCLQADEVSILRTESNCLQTGDVPIARIESDCAGVLEPLVVVVSESVDNHNDLLDLTTNDVSVDEGRSGVDQPTTTDSSVDANAPCEETTSSPPQETDSSATHNDVPPISDSVDQVEATRVAPTEVATEVDVGSSEPSLNNLSELEGDELEIDDCELLDRSSPPPSYDDATHDSSDNAIGAFGLAYGTI